MHRRRFIALSAAVLTLCAQPLAAQSVSGLYSVEGRNPDGSTYSGQLALTDTGDRITANWTVGAQSYSGQGTLSGRVIEIDWGEAYPVIYVTTASGVLYGTWSDGRALERAAPMN